MNAKTMLTMGVLSMMVASGVVKVPDSFASEAQRVDVIERIGAGGSTYSSSQGTMLAREDDGAPYSSSQPTSN